MGGHDQLAFLGDLRQDASQPVDPGRIYRLHRVVDHEEPEGFAGNVARGKKTERARQLISPLLAAGQGLRLRTVDINGLVNVAPGAGTRQLHGSKINVALEPELFPEPQGLEFDGLPSSSP